MIPEYIMLFSAIACAGAGVGLYFKRGNPTLLGIAIIGFIAVLYGTGQYFERDNVDARALGFSDAAERRAAERAGISGGDAWKRKVAGTEIRSGVKKPEDKKPEEVSGAKKVEEADAAQRPLPPDAKKLDSLAPPPAAVQATPTGNVGISNFTAKNLANRYVEVAVTLANGNEFAIKNIVVKCGDITFAVGDVSAMVEKVIPPKSELQVTGLRMGPIHPGLPPTTCLIAKFDRAN